MHPFQIAYRDPGVYLRASQRFMAQELLDTADIHAPLQQAGGNGMSKRMAGYSFRVLGDVASILRFMYHFSIFSSID